jgi:hypothetical protein
VSLLKLRYKSGNEGKIKSMNFSEVISSLSSASAFDLYRIRAAIDRVLDDPKWMKSVQSRLKVGQAVQYFDPQDNALKGGVVQEMRRKQAVVITDSRRWLISYSAINVDGVDVQIRENKTQGLGRNEVAIGDTLGFLDRDKNQRIGKVIRLNDKSVSLQCGGTQWRVAYACLHRVVDADTTTYHTFEIEAATLVAATGDVNSHPGRLA